jgi:hypothetical protein
MKKLFLLAAMAVTMTLSAQKDVAFDKATNAEKGRVATQSGNHFVGVNTSGLGFTTVKDGATNVNVGVNAGIFATQNVALVGKVGYGSNHYNGVNTNDWNYGAGMKVYLGSVLPIQVDWTGSKGSTVKPATSYVGTQLGYAWFPFDNFSIEPTLRYDWSLSDNYKHVFSGGLGANLFF